MCFGVTLKMLEDEIEGRCCNLESTLDAKRICDKLDIPHYTINCIEEFNKNVINNFISEYKNCKTPNPCIECNKYLKFGKMYELAKSLNIDYIATGHYASIEYNKEYNRYVLKKAKNIQKDQSYFLYNINKEILKDIIFPLENYKNKEEIRVIAKKYNLEVARKKDSEDICFIPDGDYRKYLKDKAKLKKLDGNIVDKEGNIIGKHKGLYNYTIGQRKGLDISNKCRLYAIGYNKENNELIVGQEAELYKTEMNVKDINLLLYDKLINKLKVNVKTRYSQEENSAIIEQISDNIINVKFNYPQKSITSGQSAVFYKDDIVIGGGKII